MEAKEKLESALDELVDEGYALLKALTDKDTSNFMRSFQNWYTKAIKVVSLLAPDRFDESRGYYEPEPKRKQIGIENYRIQDFCSGIRPAPHRYTGDVAYNADELTCALLLNQNLILDSLRTRVDGVLVDFELGILHRIQDAEIDSAESLKKVSLRAAGALSGVILETHLQRVAVAHQVAIAKKDPTIGDLNEPLKKAGVYDIDVYRKIQLMADIRNVCTHQKGKDPTPEQIDDLLNGVRSITKSVS